MSKFYTNDHEHEETQNDMGDENQSTHDENISCGNKYKRSSRIYVEVDNENINTSHNGQCNELLLQSTPHEEGDTSKNEESDTSKNEENSRFYVEVNNENDDSTSHDGQCNKVSPQDTPNENSSLRKKKKSSCTCNHASDHPQPSKWHIACTKCIARNRLKRKKSSNWDLDGIFDTYRIFEVKNEECIDLEVTVHRGENITKGSKFKDALDTPDPYIVLRIPQTSLNTPKRTTTEDDSTNPRWNQSFHFYLHRSPSEPYEMEISLMDENVLKDEAIDTQFFPLDCLEEGIPKDCTFTFKGNSKVFITFLKQKNEKTDLRFSMSLCEEEKNYLRQRRNKVLQSMETLLGDDGPHNEYEVPTIGILGSGGGFRAMIGLSGALKALQDAGILDCVTYLAGLSGSTWCISTLYSQDPISDNFTCQENTKENIEETDDNDELSRVTKSTENLNFKSTNNSRGCLNIEEFQKKLCESVGNKWEWNILKMPKYVYDMLSKYRKGQSMRPVTLVDIFGHLIGELLLGKEKKKHTKLRDFQARISEGDAPFPLFAALHATDSSSEEFSEWIEFSPYEIGIGKYGTFMKTEDFGSKFFAGKLLKKYDEMPLHYLQGIWGSAFTINLKKHLRGATNDVTEETDEFTDEIPCPNDGEDSDSDRDSDDSEGEIEDSAGRMSSLKTKKHSVDKEKSRSKKKNLLVSALDIVGIDSSYWLNTRAVKPGRIYNPFRGLSLRYSFVQDRSTPEKDTTSNTEVESMKYANGCQFQPLSEGSKKLAIMDSGFAFNSPYPLLLRPQRGVDIFLSFDFSNRKDDLKVDEHTFTQLVKAEEWAKERHIPFPKVKEKIKEYQDTEIEECYIFESTDDCSIPVILHFPLVNNKFRNSKIPGKEEDFSEFPCFGKNSAFSTFKFHYDPKEFDRLSKLMEFNTHLHTKTIIEAIKNSITNKKKGRKLSIYEITKILLGRKSTEK